MKKSILILFVVFKVIIVHAQTYSEKIEKHRRNYKQEFLQDENSPLKKEDLEQLDFYAINERYKVNATFKIAIDSAGFMMQTHSGKQKKYYQYGIVYFKLGRKKMELHVYRSDDLMKQKEYENYLFLPFTDFTNYETTFGGGRYLDLSMQDIKNGIVELDFNKCYNPYCAFADGYSCPIPPSENKLKIAIKAGEKMFMKQVKV